jgi:FAD/FMN-containing dehydrogenase
LRERAEHALAACAERGALRDAVLAQSVAQARTLWRIRETIPEAQFTNVKHDVSVPVSLTPELIERLGAALGAAFPGVRPYVFGHLGDGNLHYNVQAPVGGDPAAFLREQEERVNVLVYDQVKKFDGSISAEHGIGLLKADKLPYYKSPVALNMMKALKKALDPQNLLNPGRVVAM